MTPTISVVMSVYNGERYLREAVESVLAQTYGNFEFLIIDDGSTDSTREILRAYPDPRIRLIENERNIGLTRSLNRGLRSARGEFVARQDADDVSEPQRFQRQLNFLDSHPEVAVLGTWYTEIDADGNRCGQRDLPWEYTSLRWSLFFFCPFIHSSVMIRRAPVLERIGLYDESLRFAQDHDYWWRIARHLPVANLREFLVRFRVHAGSITNTQARSEQTGYRLRVAAVARLLGWDQGASNSNEIRYDAMYALWRGKDEEQTAAAILEAVDNVLDLHVAFCHDFKLSRSERRDHRAALLRHIGWLLIQRAENRARNGNYRDARSLVQRACRLRLRLLCHRALLRFWAHLPVRHRSPVPSISRASGG